MKAAWLALAVIGLAAPAYAQSVPAYQMGTALPNDVAKFERNGQIRNPGTVDGDNNGMGVNPFATTDKRQRGVCTNTAATSGPHSQFCIGHDAAGNGVLYLDSRAGEPPHTIKCQINGIETDCLNTALPGNFLGGPFVSQFGADTSGGADATAALQGCLAAAGGMGTCFVDPGAKLKISGNISIPTNTTLSCGYSFADNVDGGTAGLGTMPALKLDGAHTISSGGAGAWIKNCLIYRDGMTFPAANSSAFTGIAVSDAGKSGLHVTDSVILGFDTAILVTGTRPYVNHVYLDGNGSNHAVLAIENGNTDSGSFANIKIQPIATGYYPAAGTTCAGSQRPGTGVRFFGIDQVDGYIVSQNFLTQDFLIDGLALVNGMLWADGIGNICGYGSSIGINVTGNLQAPLVNVNGVNTGLVLNTNGGQNWFGTLFANLIGQDCLSAKSGFLQVGAYYTNNANITGNCGRYAIEVVSGASNLTMNFGLVELGGINNNTPPYIHNSGGLSASLGQALVISQLFTNLTPFVQNPYSGFAAETGSDRMMARLPMTVGACTGLGSGSCTVNLPGSDAGQGGIVLSPTGTPAATGTIPLTFPVPQASGRVCSFTPAGLNWPTVQPPAYGSASPTLTNVVWTTSSPLVAGSTYILAYRCSPF